MADVTFTTTHWDLASIPTPNRIAADLVDALRQSLNYINGLELLSEGGTSTTYQGTFTNGGAVNVSGYGLETNLWHVSSMTYAEPANNVSVNISADLMVNFDTDAFSGSLSSTNFKLFNLELSGIGTTYLNTFGSGSGSWQELTYKVSGLTTRFENAAVTYNGYQASGTIGQLTLISPDGESIVVSNSNKLTAPFLNGLQGNSWSYFLSAAFLDGNDHLTGTDENDSFSGFAGDDVLTGQDGSDTLDGGPGNDALDGGAGGDTASYAGASVGVSVTLATLGVPQNTGGAGLDTLLAIEHLIGSGFSDTLTGNAAVNTLDGGAGGNDTLNGGAGADTLIGGDGSDYYIVDNPADVVSESNADPISGGIDTVHSVATAFTLSANVENGRILATGAANLTGNTLDNLLFAGTGHNVLSGGAGADTLVWLYG
ncbi:MAG: hypothetical protein JNL84_11700, partial [Candidatus Accumulibacter sp.]|nr:hypothetical protein [Accumulibacter sp.]